MLKSISFVFKRNRVVSVLSLFSLKSYGGSHIMFSYSLGLFLVQELPKKFMQEMNEIEPDLLPGRGGGGGGGVTPDFK